jgi:molybdenum cofactor biosynthesis protein B
MSEGGHQHGGAPAEHRAYAPKSVHCAVLTVSDSRTHATDSSGQAIQERLEAAGHKVVERALVRDDPADVRQALVRAIARSDVDAVLVTGGTGVAQRDGTPEAIEPLLYKKLDGFGELFRQLSFEEIGAAALLSRALAGTARRTAIFVMPGSSGAVRLAMERLILPELAHIVGQLRR